MQLSASIADRLHPRPASTNQARLTGQAGTGLQTAETGLESQAAVLHAGGQVKEINRTGIMQLELILTATVGRRWQTVQKAAYTPGGLGDPALLDTITACIQRNGAFAGQDKKCLKCASKWFADGVMHPLI